jgi:hypothetical protein
MRLPDRRAHGLTLLVALGTAISPAVARGPFLPTENDGDATIVRDSNRPAVVAAFPRESYRPGDVARMVVSGREREVAVSGLSRRHRPQPADRKRRDDGLPSKRRRRTGRATTSRTCNGSPGPAARRTTSPTPIWVLFVGARSFAPRTH